LTPAAEVTPLGERLQRFFPTPSWPEPTAQDVSPRLTPAIGPAAHLRKGRRSVRFVKRGEPCRETDASRNRAIRIRAKRFLHRHLSQSEGDALRVRHRLRPSLDQLLTLGGSVSDYDSTWAAPTAAGCSPGCTPWRTTVTARAGRGNLRRGPSRYRPLPRQFFKQVAHRSSGLTPHSGLAPAVPTGAGRRGA
jgi:hypothetical protein